MKPVATILVISTFILSCSSSSNNETSLEVSSAKEVNTYYDIAEQYKINIDSSSVSWIGSKPAGKHHGVIPIVSGEISLEDNNIVGGKVVMNINGITANDLLEDVERHDRLINHLKSDDFFDAENYPEAVFEITSCATYNPNKEIIVKEEFESEHKPASATEHMTDTPTHYITGNLTMRDTTLSITFPVFISVNNKEIVARAKFNIDRTNWNLKYRDEASVADKTKDRFIYNTVNVGFRVLAKIEN